MNCPMEQSISYIERHIVFLVAKFIYYKYHISYDIYVCHKTNFNEIS